MHIKRQIFEALTKSKKSLLLVGPRQTGKSTILSELSPDLVLNLADEETYFNFLKNPALIKEVSKNKKTIFVDEIQRIPSMLNTIQVLIDADKSKRFLLTGSSARKLKRGQANLLPGRIHYYELGPLSFYELDNHSFDINKALVRGMLPGIYFDESDDWKQTLKSYVAVYLKEEVQAEALTRDIQGFSRFFDVTIGKSGQSIDFSKYSSQAMIERNTSRRYFDILTDTLILDRIDSFAKSEKRRLTQHPKFYCFDVGVLNACLSGWSTGPDRIGNLFEHFIVQQIRSLQKSLNVDIRLTTYRTENNAEVDLILETDKKVFALEIKASKNIGSSDLSGLKSFADFYGKKHMPIVLYMDKIERSLSDGIRALPWQQGLREVFSLPKAL